VLPAVGGETSTWRCSDHVSKSFDSQISRYRLPLRTAASQDVPEPIDRSVAIKKKVLPSGDCPRCQHYFFTSIEYPQHTRIKKGSRSPLVPSVEVKTELPSLSSCQSKALLPLLAARKIFSPASELSLKYANTYPSLTAASCRGHTLSPRGITAAVADDNKARDGSRRMMKLMSVCVPHLIMVYVFSLP
jgi:hypothetical protein